MKYCPQCRADLHTTIIENTSRLACSSKSCNYIYYDNPIPVVAAIVEYDGKVILGRKKEWPGTWFGIIAGFLEKGETPEQAVMREIEEEVGLAGDLPAFLGYYSFFEANQIILAYHVVGKGTIRVGEELEEIKLVAPEEITPWPVGTGPAVKDWLEKRNS